MTDVFKVQDEIAGAVVEQLKIKLLGAAPTMRVTDSRAYALFLQGREAPGRARRGNRAVRSRCTSRRWPLIRATRRHGTDSPRLLQRDGLRSTGGRRGAAAGPRRDQAGAHERCNLCTRVRPRRH